MATSILDYIFRELAVSYLGRYDLAHVQPSNIGATVMGGGVAEDKPGQKASASVLYADQYVSKGLTRGLHHKVVIVQDQTQIERVGGATTFETHGALAYALRAEDEDVPLGPFDVNARDGTSAAFSATHLSVSSRRSLRRLSFSRRRARRVTRAKPAARAATSLSFATEPV